MPKCSGRAARWQNAPLRAMQENVIQEMSQHNKWRRYAIAGGIIVFWLAMMSGLVYREVIRPRLYAEVERQIDAEAKAPAAEPRDYWLGIFLGGGERAGFVHVSSRPEARDAVAGQHVRIAGRATLNLFNFDAGLALSGQAWAADDFSRADFDFTLHAGESESRAYGRFEGDNLSATFATGGIETPLNFPISKEMLGGLGLGGPAYEVPHMEPGDEVYIDAFDPTTMRPSKARLYCEKKEMVMAAGKMVEAAVITISLGGIVSRTWVTPDLETVKLQTAFGIEVRQITEAEALEPLTPSERMPLLEATIVVPTGAPLQRGVAHSRLRLTGLPADVKVPEDGVQRVEDGVLEITAPDPMREVAATLSEEERAEALASDAMVNAGAEAIRAAAAEATGDAAGDWEKARRIYAWVYREIAKVPTLSIPAAMEVLRTREGDCNEHTVLFTAMARAAGIPCRIAIGLVYSEALGGFGYHAWPEVWVGQWVPMDPTLGQPVCDATHIKLLNGGIDKWPLLAGFMGKIQIEVLESGGAVEMEPEPEDEAAEHMRQ